MIDITLENFQNDLIQASLQQPVLLDIWAPWCGPCRSLGPILEKLETEYAGRFVLAKLNADEQQDISSQLGEMFGVRSIPFCVMFAGGQPVDGFVGAIPEEKIREFLDKHVPSADAMAPDADWVEAEGVAEDDSLDAAIDKLQQALAADPENDVVRFDYIKLLLENGFVAEARNVFAPIASKVLMDQRIAALSAWLSAMEAQAHARHPEELLAAIAANKRDFEARFALAQGLFAAQQYTQAMDELLEILMRDKAWQDGLARKTYVAILELMSKPAPKPAANEAKSTLEIAGKAVVTSADPVIDQYRRRLSMVIF
ncbi:tetratricopeptide repeat protein [Leptothrix ochracea]|uniref:tetratricopeptide repeat protein n=1 Tax=Leptothrix ochracea TaxID=735331 RepID=UPI0034E293E1